MKLAEYLDRHDITDAAFAERVGVSQSTVTRWVRGKLHPSWAMIPHIMRCTDNHVTANDFVPDDEAAKVWQDMD